MAGACELATATSILNLQRAPAFTSSDFREVARKGVGVGTAAGDRRTLLKAAAAVRQRSERLGGRRLDTLSDFSAWRGISSFGDTRELHTRRYTSQRQRHYKCASNNARCNIWITLDAVVIIVTDSSSRRHRRPSSLRCFADLRCVGQHLCLNF